MRDRLARMLGMAVSLLALCAPGMPAAQAQPDGQGWIVASVAAENTMTRVELHLRSRTDDKAHYVALNLGALFGPDAIDIDGRKGFVRVLAVPAGAYRVANFHLSEPVANRRWSSREDFDKPFEVRAGEVTYLGEFVGTGTLSKPFLGVRAIEKPYFLVADRLDRDMAIAKKDKPELANLPVRNLAPFVVPGGPRIFLTKKLPDAQ